MASHQNDTVSSSQPKIEQPENDVAHHHISDEEEEEEELDSIDDEDDDEAAFTIAPSVTVTDAVPISSVAPQPRESKPPPPPVDDSRRMFQRLWTDEDEIELLQGFLEYTTQKSTARSSSHHPDTSLFYDQIKSKLQLDFNKNQLVEKLRRLKKKYRNVCSKMSSGKEFVFKSPHDQATFEISKQIWSNVGARSVKDNGEEDFNSPKGNSCCEDKGGLKSRKRSRSGGLGSDGNANANVNVSGGEGKVGDGGNANVARVVEETVRSCVSPVVKEVMSSVVGGLGGMRGFGGVGMSSSPVSMGLLGGFGGGGLLNFGMGGEGVTDEKWRKQQILELEVYSKRLDLMQEQVKAALEELRSMGG